MATRACPECGQSVKLENMRRHFSNVHPGKDATAAISEEEHRQLQRANRPTRPPLYAQKSFQVVLAVVVILAIGYVGLPYILGANSGSAGNLVTYCGVEGTIEHYHPLLVINDNGAPQHLPYDPSAAADVGAINQPGFTNPAYYCPGGQLHVLHTHDGSGIIHVELPFAPKSAPTLGQFFEIWGEPLGPATVWTFSGHVTAQVYDADTLQTTDYSTNPTSIPLYAPAAGANANPYPIPQNLIFGGQYGTGQSGGYFSGEVIWLNVTA